MKNNKYAYYLAVGILSSLLLTACQDIEDKSNDIGTHDKKGIIKEDINDDLLDEEEVETDTANEDLNLDDLSFDILRERLNLGTNKDVVLELLGEPTQDVFDAMSGEPRYRYDINTVEGYRYIDEDGMSSVDIDGIKDGKVEFIVILGYANNEVSDLFIGYKNGDSVHAYLNTGQLEKTDIINFE